MVKIAPFKGITYNSKTQNLDKTLFAPPYDVISSAYQDELYGRSPYNVVRLILGKTSDADNDTDNRYTRAANDYTKWLKEGVLVQSEIPKLYYYVQIYKDAKGVEVTRKGFITRCYLEDFESKKVLPHEETMGGPKKDRLALMMTTKTNFSQIFAIYSDPDMFVDKTLESACPAKPFVDIVDDDNVRHIFYEVTDESAIKKVQAAMAEKSILIADGHHRYETALQYRDLKRAENNGDQSEDKAYNSMMIYLANLDDEGLRVYPTHRVLKSAVNISLKDLMQKLKSYFSIKEIKFDDFKQCFPYMESENLNEIPVGLVSKQNPGILYILKPDQKKVTEGLKKQNVPEMLSKLDVTILHRLILETVMGLDTIELKNQNNIEFIRNEDELSEKYNLQQAEFIFLLSPPDVAMVKDVCMAGFRMPQKTTYFYPKLLSGIVFNSLE